MSNQTWGTPLAVFDPLNAIFYFDLDVAAEAGNTKCEHYYGPDHVVEERRDGLKAPWGELSCWCNPPYGNILPWVNKAAEEVCATTVMLLPVDTSTAWFKRIFETADEVWFMQPRVKFEFAEGSPRWANMIVVWRPFPAGKMSTGTPMVRLWTWK